MKKFIKYNKKLLKTIDKKLLKIYDNMDKYYYIIQIQGEGEGWDNLISSAIYEIDKKEYLTDIGIDYVIYY
jgi:hypothetical protein